MTELKSTLVRELRIGESAYRLTIDTAGLKLMLKGRRKGLEIAWRDLISGEAAMAVALRASLTAPTLAKAPAGRAKGKHSTARRAH